MTRKESAGFVTTGHVACALLLLPFFEPLSFNLFVRFGYYARFFSAVADLFLLGRLFAASWAFLYCLRKYVIRELVCDKAAVLFFLHVLLMAVSCVVNGSIGAGIAGQIYNYLGFILLCGIMMRRSPELFLESGLLMFGTLSLIGCASIFIHPHGWIKADDAYYLLGGKNTAFPYYFCFIFSYFALKGFFRREVPRIGWLIVIFTAGAVVADSSSSTACLLLLLVVYIATQYFLPVMRGVKPWVLAVILAVLMISIYMGTVFAPLQSLIKSLGRNATFTGRDVLWTQAVDYLKAHPLFGSGEHLTFTLKSGTVTNHAHSQYLNRLAKYGAVPFIFLILGLFVLFRRLLFAKKKLLFNLIGTCVVIYLLHMCFDDYSYNFFLYTVMTAVGLSSGDIKGKASAGVTDIVLKDMIWH